LIVITVTPEFGTIIKLAIAVADEDVAVNPEDEYEATPVVKPANVPPETVTFEAAVPAETLIDKRPLDTNVAVRSAFTAVDGVAMAAIIPVLGTVPAVMSATLVPALAGATDRTPAPNVATATSAMRLRSVFVDMFFLSLVRFRNFLDLARRSFDLLIPLLL
jgi:hypothetical protein